MLQVAGGSAMSSNYRPQVAALVFLAGAAVALAGCPGREMEKGEVIRSQLEPAPQDERLEDQHPAFSPELTQFVETMEGEQLWFNASQAIIGLDMVGMIEDDAALEGRIFPSFGAALAAAPGSAKPLFSLDQADSLAKYSDDRIYAGLELANHAGDANYPGGKQGYLRDLLQAVADQPDSPARAQAQAYLAAALSLGGETPELDASLDAAVEQELAAFEQQPQYSKPVGFYTESAELQAIFRRDRLLQQPFGSEPISANSYPQRSLEAAVVLARAVQSSPQLLAAYTAYLRLAELMTNPVSNLNLLDLLPYENLWDDPAALKQALQDSPAWQRSVQRGNISQASLGVAFWPFSTAKENRLFARLYGLLPELPPTSTMDDFIKAIRAGEVSLAPEPDSGWYDYQLYALEPLLLPERALEADKLLLRAKYQQRLVNAFKSLATQRRETHIKQLQAIEQTGMAAPPLELSNELQLTVEPAATNYLRVARSYGYLAQALAGLYGTEQYAQLKLADGALLTDFLAGARRKFLGLYLLACNDIMLPLALEPADLAGLGPPDSVQLPAMDEDTLNRYPVLRTGRLSPEQQQLALYALQHAQEFREHYAEKPCAAYDARVIVPVLSDPEREDWRYWAVLGVQFQRVRCWYAQAPRTVPAATGGREVPRDEANAQLAEGMGSTRELEEKEALLLCYVFAELTLGKEPPTREELRAVCDKHDSIEAITRALQKRFR